MVLFFEKLGTYPIRLSISVLRTENFLLSLVTGSSFHVECFPYFRMKK